MILNGTEFDYINLNHFTVEVLKARGELKEVSLMGTAKEMDKFFDDVHGQEYVDYYDSKDGEGLMGPGGIKINCICVQKQK
jgi:hypothetical protein